MEDLKALTTRITEEVLRRLSPGLSAGGVLAIAAGPVYQAELAESYIKNTWSNVTFALLDGVTLDTSFKVETVVTQQQKDALSARLGSFEKVALVTPPLWLLKALALGDDSLFPAALVLRPLLWGKEVVVLLDFEPPKAGRSAALAGVAEYVSALEDMGAKIVCLPRESAEAGAKDLVTEQDIKDACKKGIDRVTIKPGAIVTQLARDTAKELGIAIET